MDLIEQYEQRDLVLAMRHASDRYDIPFDAELCHEPHYLIAVWGDEKVVATNQQVGYSLGLMDSEGRIVQPVPSESAAVSEMRFSDSLTVEVNGEQIDLG